MNFNALSFLGVCVVILVVSYAILLVVDRYKYNKKLNSCGNYIPFNMIPKPTRIIHYCRDNMDNIRYTKGDIFVLQTYEHNEFKMKADLVYKYYIAFEFDKIVELSSAQIDRIETIHNLKIREGK